MRSAAEIVLFGAGFCGPSEALDALADAHPIVIVAVIAAVITAVLLAVAQRWKAFAIVASLLGIAGLIAAWTI